MDRAKNDADTIVKDQTGLADEDTIKELYGEADEEVVDSNSAFSIHVLYACFVTHWYLQ
jgi:peptide chain release factor subunit 3